MATHNSTSGDSSVPTVSWTVPSAAVSTDVPRYTKVVRRPDLHAVTKTQIFSVTILATERGQPTPSVPTTTDRGAKSKSLSYDVYYSASSIPETWRSAPWDAGRLCSANGVRDILLALLAGRDFLGHQLSHATGLINDAELEGLANEFFNHVGLETDDHLITRALLLYELLHDRLDTDVTAAALRCDFEQAERVLTRVASWVRQSLSSARTNFSVPMPLEGKKWPQTL